VLQECYKSVTGVLQECYRSVIEVLQSFTGVLRVHKCLALSDSFLKEDFWSSTSHMKMVVGVVVQGCYKSGAYRGRVDEQHIAVHRSKLCRPVRFRTHSCPRLMLCKIRYVMDGRLYYFFVSCCSLGFRTHSCPCLVQHSVSGGGGGGSGCGGGCCGGCGCSDSW
jgi:uncharacterized membrane protein YgcG